MSVYSVYFEVESDMVLDEFSMAELNAKMVSSTMVDRTFTFEELDKIIGLSKRKFQVSTVEYPHINNGVVVKDIRYRLIAFRK